MSFFRNVVSIPMTKPKSKTTRRPAGTLNKLCAALRLSKRQIGSLLREGMPDSVDAALAWRKAETSSDSAEQLRRERIKLVRTQRDRMELEIARSKNELLTRSSVLEEHRKIGAAVCAFVRSLEVEIPQLCYGLPLSKSLPLAKKKIRELQQLWADRDAQFWGENPTPDFSEPATDPK